MGDVVRRVMVLGAASLLSLGLGSGCETVPTPPPPEAVLEGTWDLTTNQDLALSKTVLVFDRLGRLEEMQNVFLVITVTERNVHRTTEVDGSNVTIMTTTNLIFRGTFNGDFTVATGQLSTEFTIPFTSTQISIDQGDATLTKRQ